MLAGAAPESKGPTTTAEIGVRAEVVPGGANPLLVESDNARLSKNLSAVLERAARGETVVEELAEFGAVIRVEAHPSAEGPNPVELVVEYVGN